ncbi:hypothetical protein, partial [Polymorphobacter multimanifer]|uniref:hypothetical protein n=1 Tax=Polymorphobacter multimanifer TaxID=1070431 RepID=UPI001667BAD8
MRLAVPLFHCLTISTPKLFGEMAVIPPEPMALPLPSAATTPATALPPGLSPDFVTARLHIAAVFLRGTSAPGHGNMAGMQMLDARAATPLDIVRLKDYRPPDWLVPNVALDFDLDGPVTVVRATLSVVRNGLH